MRLNLLYIVTLALFTTSSTAAEVADVDAEMPTARTRSFGRLGTSDAERLFSGTIPRVSNHDRKASQGRRDCRATWTAVRRAKFTPAPIAASYDTLRARGLAAGINPKFLDRTLAVFLKNQDAIPNQKFITVVDFSKRSTEKRLFTIDLRDGSTKAYYTSAGRGSDPNADGYATRFSNREHTNQSSLGCYIAAGEYHGSKGHSLKLHGFEPTNDLACKRSIIMHPAWYVGQGAGRSNGCIALRSGDKAEVYRKVSGGGLICAYHDGKTTVSAGKSPRRVRRHHHRPRVISQRSINPWGTSYAF